MYARTSSPLSGAFVVSWLVWNYKVIFILFSSMPVLDKFSYVETMHFSDWKIALGQGFVYPLLSAVAVILVYPFPARWIYQYSKINQNKMKKIRQEIEDEAPMTLAESQELKQNMFRLKFEYIAQITKANDEISVKDSLIATLQSELDDLTPRKPVDRMSMSELENVIQSREESEGSDDLSSDAIKVIGVLVDLGGKSGEGLLVTKIPFHKVQAEYYIEDLTNKGFLARNYDATQNKIIVELTTAGKGIAIDHDLIPGS